MVFTAIDSSRYIEDAKALLVEFLDYYLRTDHSALFARHDGVDVMSDAAGLPPDGLRRPRVVVSLQGEEIDMTLFNAATRQHNGEHHRMTFSIVCETSDDLGGSVDSGNLCSAVQLAFARHSADLEAAGMVLLSRSADPAEQATELGLYANTVKVEANVDVTGEAVRTLELELGRFTVSAIGQGEYADGAELDTPHVLRLKLLTGTGSKAFEVTVTALNQAGEARSLTGTIPINRGAGTYIDLTPDHQGDTFTDVTNIAITGTSGLPGEAFAVYNVPLEL